jgi:hypothetical protein
MVRERTTVGYEKPDRTANDTNVAVKIVEVVEQFKR